MKLFKKKQKDKAKAEEIEKERLSEEALVSKQPLREAKDPLWVRWFPFLVSMVIGLAVADLVSDIIATWLHDIPSKIQVKKATIGTGEAGVELRQSVLSDLLLGNLFDHTNYVPGQVDFALGGEGLDPSKAIPSNLNYKIIGTIVFSDSHKSLVSLAKGRDVNSYVQDEILETGYKVWGIQRIKVFIHNLKKNQLEYLELKVEEKRKTTARPRVPGRPSRVSPTEIKKESDTQFTIEKSFIQEKMGNLQELLTQAKAVPTGDGFRVESIAPGSLFEAIGIQPGDVITGVNEKDVRTQADAIMLYNQFKSASINKIQLKVKRGGEDITINYDLK